MHAPDAFCVQMLRKTLPSGSSQDAGAAQGSPGVLVQVPSPHPPYNALRVPQVRTASLPTDGLLSCCRYLWGAAHLLKSFDFCHIEKVSPFIQA